MAGIYIHIPFCRRKCHYCNFFSLASQKYREEFLDALGQEILLTRRYLDGEPLNTIYFGGGTPSLYRPDELQHVIEQLCPPAPDNPDARMENMEITLEMNPEDVTEDYVSALKDTWFNRFSVGVQSFFDEDLLMLNRSHSADRAIRAVNLLQQAGFGNLSIDLIFGIPSSSSARWERNLEIAFSLEVPHISAYALTVEPHTPLAWRIAAKKSLPVSEEIQADHFRLLMKRMQEHGFLQYEISNYCKPGHHAIHNTNYWKSIPYLGLGPSAHSYNRISRRWNISSLSEYIAGIQRNECIFEEETLTIAMKYNEYVMTSLRTMWGCDLEKIIYELQITNYELIRKRAASFVQQGLLTKHSGIYFLTDDGKLFADRIAAGLFVSDE